MTSQWMMYTEALALYCDKHAEHNHCVGKIKSFLVYSAVRIITSRFERVNIIIYNKPTRCNSGSIVFIKNYKYALHVSDALCVHHQEHYKL